MRKITAVDLFCGAGGTSTGLAQAADRAGLVLDLLAVNHWEVAIATHTKNHPAQRHMCAAINSVDPKKVMQGKVDLLWASPECTHHSIARGGKPINDQSRMSAWEVVRWAADLLPQTILVENVKEFQTWGPIGHDGRPLQRRKGETFQAFLQALRSLGYKVDYRVMNAADYGGVTTRERLFVQARRGRAPITWPDQTHSRQGGANLFGAMERWRPAREIIDWSIPGQSIFSRKKPLAKATLERIAAGLRRFGGANAEPFLLLLNRYKDRAYGVSEPMPTVTATSSDFALVEPFLMGAGGTTGQQKPQSINDPMGAVLTQDRRALIEPTMVPFVIGQQSCSAPRSVDQPIPTVATAGAISLVEPFMVPLRRNSTQLSVDSPVPTLTAGGNHVGLCEPYVVEMRGQSDVRSVDEPLSTVTTKGAHHAVVEPWILPLNHGSKDFRSHSMEEPMPTITTVDAWGMVEPMLVEYNGTGDAHPVSQPVPTVTTKDRFGLLECDGYILDIRFRMLQPHELAAAMGFPAGYEFAGNREQKVKQIGNAVEVNMARALGAAVLGINVNEVAA